jgi:hypothetical protein
VGLTTFTLVFSKAMDSSVTPSVTFALSSPYTAHVVESAPGWLPGNQTWQGRFAIQSDSGDGLNTIRVSDAQSLDGFVIPDDTIHKFQIDTSGALAAANTGSVTGTAYGTEV